jgi:hypothetical protein
MSLERSEAASEVLLGDLREDRGMGWLPEKGMWLNYLRIATPAGELKNDLALNVSGGAPSRMDAGLGDWSGTGRAVDDPALLWPWMLAALVAVGSLWATGRFATHSR